MLSKAKKQLIITIAKQAEDKRKNEKLSDEETINWFVEQMKNNKISLKGWFAIDDEIRKNYETENWFWIIRRVRNQVAIR